MKQLVSNRLELYKLNSCLIQVRVFQKYLNKNTHSYDKHYKTTTDFV
jgi:hypothetical protein